MNERTIDEQARQAAQYMIDGGYADESEVLDEQMESAETFARCEALDGCMVEPDGWCEHGYPSWLVYVGLI